MTVSPAMCVTGNMASNMSLEKKKKKHLLMNQTYFLSSQ